MSVLLQQLASAAYLLAAVTAVLGSTLRRQGLLRAAVAALGLGVLLHTGALWQLHTLAPPPPMTSLPMALSFAAWIGTLVYLALLLWVRGIGLSVIVAPAAFLGAGAGWLLLRPIPPGAAPMHPMWSHLHVLLATCGLAILGVAGAAGLLYTLHHRTIKAKRRPVAGLPSLETLDRVNTLALALGFLLLTLGVVTGVLWVRATQGRLWVGDVHADVTLLAWLIYAAVTVSRFVLRAGARQVALYSALGFAFLVFAVVGVGAFS